MDAHIRTLSRVCACACTCMHERMRAFICCFSRKLNKQDGFNLNVFFFITQDKGLVNHRTPEYELRTRADIQEWLDDVHDTLVGLVSRAKVIMTLYSFFFHLCVRVSIQ